MCNLYFNGSKSESFLGPNNEVSKGRDYGGQG